MTAPLFMIHGMWCRPWCWQNYKEMFGGRFSRIVTPTLRHHDVDPKDPPPSGLGTCSLLDYADDLEKEIRGLERPPVLIGHSMGGLLAQILAARGLAKALVLIAPGAPAGINSLTPSVVKSFFQILSRWGFWRKPHRISYEAAEYALFHRMPEKGREPLYTRLVYESGRAAAEIGFWFFDPGRATGVDPERVSCPVYVCVGAQDRVTPAAVVEKIAGRYRSAGACRTFADHGHWIIGEPGWEQIAGDILQWIEGQGE